MADPLGSAWAKLGRANDHARYVNQLLQDVVDFKPYRFQAEVHREPPADFGGRQIDRYRVVVYPKIIRNDDSLDWGVAVGDFVAAARSALDHVVWGLSSDGPDGPAPTHPLPRGSLWAQVGFPVCQSQPQWDGGWKAKLRFIQGRADEFYRFQPFVTGPSDPAREPLAVLHDLWVIDKHRSVSIARAFLKIDGIGTFPPAPFDLPELYAFLKWTRPPGWFDDNDVLAEVEFLTSINVSRTFAEQYLNRYLGRSFGIAFEDASPAYGAEVGEMLMRIEQAVHDVLAHFESLLPLSP